LLVLLDLSVIIGGTFMTLGLVAAALPSGKGSINAISINRRQSDCRSQ
jgi:hypothetical protein